MYETYINAFLALADRMLMDVYRFLGAGGSDILHLSAIALLLFLLAAGIVKKHRGTCSEAVMAKNTHASHRASDGFFERKRTLRLKSCPNCAAELIISALVCDACDYNFLAARPMRPQRALPPPTPTSKVSRRRVASAGRRHR